MPLSSSFKTSLRARNPKGYVEYTVPGTYTFTVPARVYKIRQYAIGGGCGGGSSGDAGGGGGGGVRDDDVTPYQEITVVVAAGGSNGSSEGEPGGDTTVGELTAAGGTPGKQGNGSVTGANVNPFENRGGAGGYSGLANFAEGGRGFGGGGGGGGDASSPDDLTPQGGGGSPGPLLVPETGVNYGEDGEWAENGLVANGGDGGRAGGGGGGGENAPGGHGANGFARIEWDMLKLN